MTQIPQTLAVTILNSLGRLFPLTFCVYKLMTVSVDSKQDFRNHFHELNGCHTKCFTPPATPILETPPHSHLTSIAVSYKS